MPMARRSAPPEIVKMVEVLFPALGKVCLPPVEGAEVAVGAAVGVEVAAGAEELAGVAVGVGLAVGVGVADPAVAVKEISRGAEVGADWALGFDCGTFGATDWVPCS